MKVAVCDISFCAHPALKAELLALHPDARFNDPDVQLQGDALVRFVGDAEAAIIGLSRITGPVLDALPGMGIVSKYGVGMDGIDLSACEVRGVRVGWRPGVNRHAVAEFALGQLITLLRGLHSTHAAVVGGGWSRAAPGASRQLSEVTVGVLGCGQVGAEVMRLCRAFGARVLACDVRDVSAICEARGAAQVDLETLLAESDALTLHTPLTGATRGLLDGAMLDRLPAGAVVVNTARGGIVDEVALADRLRDGRLGGAAFDVYASEPPAGSPLLALPNFRASAHLASGSEAGKLAMGRAAIAGLTEHRRAADVRAEIERLGGYG